MNTADGQDTADRLSSIVANSLDAQAKTQDLAREAYQSRTQFHRLFLSVVEETPAAMRRRLLLERAAYQLGHNGMSVTGERGRKSNYVYGSSKAGLTAFVDGLRNRIDREGVRVMTIKPRPVKTAMTEGMKSSAKFADVEVVATSLVKAIDMGTDVVYVPGIWRVIMAVIRMIPERVFKKLNL